MANGYMQGTPDDMTTLGDVYNQGDRKQMAPPVPWLEGREIADPSDPLTQAIMKSKYVSAHLSAIRQAPPEQKRLAYTASRRDLVDRGLLQPGGPGDPGPIYPGPESIHQMHEDVHQQVKQLEQHRAAIDQAARADTHKHDAWERLNNFAHGRGWQDMPELEFAPPQAHGIPAMLNPGTPQYRLTKAQDAARSNPRFQPRGAPDSRTFCNMATAAIVRDTGEMSDGLLDAHGRPNLANDDAKRLATSPHWRVATPQEAQNAANAGRVTLGVISASGHGHIVTVRPKMLPGTLDADKYGPIVNNIGAKVGINSVKQVFRKENPPTWYIPFRTR